ncbi:MAG: hemolysin family protein [Fibrobacterota bacterium]
MDSSIPLLSVLLALSGTALFFLATVKTAFSHAESEYMSLDSELLRFIASKIVRLNEQKIHVSTTVSFAKTFFTSLFVIALHQLYSILLDANTWSLLGITLLTTIILLPILTYTVPRMIANSSRLRFIVADYFFYRIISILFLPFTALMVLTNLILSRITGYNSYFNFLSQEEQKMLDDAGLSKDGLDDSEKQMIHNIFNFDKTSVKEIMLPRIDIEALEVEATYDEALEKINAMGHSRIPVYETTIDKIVGLLYVKDIMAWISNNPGQEWNIKKLMRKPHFVPVSKELDDLMADMKSQRSHMVVVVDEYGGTAGLVTMEDILEEIVGEIHDEHDEHREPVKKVGEHRYIVDPHIELDDLAERINHPFDFKNDDYNTLGGLVYFELGDVPKQNTRLKYQSCNIRITKMDKQRIEEIEITLPAEAGTLSEEN